MQCAQFYIENEMNKVDAFFVNGILGYLKEPRYAAIPTGMTLGYEMQSCVFYVYFLVLD